LLTLFNIVQAEYLIDKNLAQALDIFDKTLNAISNVFKLDPSNQDAKTYQGLCYLNILKIKKQQKCDSESLKSVHTLATKALSELNDEWFKYYNLACLNAVYGDEKETERQLRILLEKKHPRLTVYTLDNDHDFDSVRSSQWFVKLRSELG